MKVRHTSVTWLHRGSQQEILARWISEPVSAVITETHGVLTTQWLFLDCVGEIVITAETNTSPSSQQASIAEFFAFIDHLAEALPVAIPAVAGYLSYEALMRHHHIASHGRPDNCIGRYALYRRIIEIRSDLVREHTLSYEDLPPCVTPHHSFKASHHQPDPQPTVSLDILRDYLTSADPIGNLTRHFAQHPTLSATTHRNRVTTIQEMIRNGDVYQVNLSMHLAVRAALDPAALCQWLTGPGHSSQMALLRWDERLIASASPELFLRRDGDTVTCRPIKGTRPRGHDPIEDRAHLAHLAHSPKDRAELSMIVDLVRNDLHRVCLPGSVQVVAHATIEQHAFVHHTVSTITGTLAPGTSTHSLVDSLFPSGSITGAPKVAALRAIATLEPHYRDVYCGAIGFFGGNHVAHHNVAIRTISAERGIVSLWAGGGITIESDPAREYDECLWKLLTALQLLSKGSLP